MVAYFRFILRHRWIVLALLTALTVLSGYSISRGIFATSIGGLFLGEDPAYHRYLERASKFGNNEVVIFTVEDPDPLAQESQARLGRIVQRVRVLPTVRSVRSVLDIFSIQGQDDALVVRTYAERALEKPESRSVLYEKLRADPLARGLFVSDDGQHSAVVVEVEAESDLPAESAPTLIGDMVNIFVDEGCPREGIWIVGPMANLASVLDETRFNIRKLFPLVCLTLLVTVWIIFRRLWPVALTMFVSLIAVVWTMGFSVLLDRNISILASMIPPVILIISFSDVVHLCSAYLLELGSGASKKEAIFASATDVGKACILTSVTTLFGFLAMSFVPTPAFRHLGAVLGFGVAMALLIAVTLTPIFFSLLPKPRPWRVGSTGRVQDLLDRLLTAIARLPNRRPRTVVIVFAVVLVVMAIGLSRLKVETDFAKRLDEDHVLRVENRQFRDQFSGANMMDVFIEAPEKEGLMDPDRFGRIVAFSDSVQKMPGVAGTFSLVNVIETIHTELNRDDPSAGRFPTTRQALAQYLLLFEMSGGEDLDRLVDFSRKTMRLTLQMRDEAVRKTAHLGDRVLAEVSETIGQSADVEVTGLVYLMGKWLDVILAGQRRGLSFAFITIALLMILGLRSLRAGLWSMVPNAFPLLFLGGYLGLFWDSVDSDVLGLAMIAIGIGVDDTIHFLRRLRIESERCDSLQQAIERTFHFSGRGIVITTIILVVGFAPFSLSDYLSVNMMGTLLPMTLIVALLADLILVPALVQLGVIRFRAAGQSRPPSNDPIGSPTDG